MYLTFDVTPIMIQDTDQIRILLFRAFRTPSLRKVNLKYSACAVTIKRSQYKHIYYVKRTEVPVLFFIGKDFI